MNDLSFLENKIKKFFKYTIDEDTDLKDVIQQGIYKIESLTGTEINFVENLEAFALLQNFVRYSINYSEEYFEENFHREILRLTLSEGVRDSVGKN